MSAQWKTNQLGRARTASKGQARGCGCLYGREIEKLNEKGDFSWENNSTIHFLYKNKNISNTNYSHAWWRGTEDMQLIFKGRKLITDQLVVQKFLTSDNKITQAWIGLLVSCRVRGGSVTRQQMTAVSISAEGLGILPHIDIRLTRKLISTRQSAVSVFIHLPHN